MSATRPSFPDLDLALKVQTPEPCRWNFPDPATADERGFIDIGADLEPATLLGAYCQGLFPMPERLRRIGWWSPDPRGIIEFDQFRVSKSLRASCRRYEVRVNTCFGEVMTSCATQPRPGGWINKSFIDAYSRLHQMGWAHSIEVFDETGALVGGLYGIKINGFFAGESMFSSRTDASKVALTALVDVLERAGVVLLDVQWTTDHLRSLGATDLAREKYLERLAVAVQ
jgi:leucyl/phenylalanyl-tRNA---protein transferase